MNAEPCEQRIEGSGEPVVQQAGKEIDPGEHGYIVSCAAGEWLRWKERDVYKRQVQERASSRWPVMSLRPDSTVEPTKSKPLAAAPSPLDADGWAI